MMKAVNLIGVILILALGLITPPGVALAQEGNELPHCEILRIQLERVPADSKAFEHFQHRLQTECEVSTTSSGQEDASTPLNNSTSFDLAITVQDLGTLPDGSFSRAWAINDLSQVAGTGAIAVGYHAFLWTESGGMQDLGTLPGGNWSRGLGINDSGQVVGTSHLYDDFTGEYIRGFVWNADDGMTELLSVYNWPLDSDGRDVNNLGHLVGASDTGSYFIHAAMWNADLYDYGIDLGTLPGGYFSVANGINDFDQVVGYSETQTASGYRNHAFQWTKNGGMIDLGALADRDSFAHDINNLGQVVGGSQNADGNQHAFLWTEDQGMKDLGTLGGPVSVAYGVNDLGQVVGLSLNSNGTNSAFLWTADTGMIELDSLGGTWSYAYSINNLGQAVGECDTADGPAHACLWTIPLAPVTPQEKIDAIIDNVVALTAATVINEGLGNSLIVKLDTTLRHLDRGNTNAACNTLQAFENHIESLVDEEVLPSGDAQLLIDGVNDIRGDLQCQSS